MELQATSSTLGTGRMQAVPWVGPSFEAKRKESHAGYLVLRAHAILGHVAEVRPMIIALIADVQSKGA